MASESPTIIIDHWIGHFKIREQRKKYNIPYPVLFSRIIQY